MFAVYRIKLEEYRSGGNWLDDGCLYGTQLHMVEREAERRKMVAGLDHDTIRASKPEIVVVHETFLRDLKTTPVMSSLKGTHPADMGLLQEYKQNKSIH